MNKKALKNFIELWLSKDLSLFYKIKYFFGFVGYIPHSLILWYWCFEGDYFYKKSLLSFDINTKMFYTKL